MQNGFKTILLPVDFSVHCEPAARYAAWFAEKSAGTVHIAHVVDNPADAIYEPEQVPAWVMVEHAEKKARELLEQTAAKCLPPTCRRQIHVLSGDPYERILELARSLPADLIVAASRGRGGIAHLVIGSVAEKLVRHAPCPVFIVRVRS